MCELPEPNPLNFDVTSQQIERRTGTVHARELGQENNSHSMGGGEEGVTRRELLKRLDAEID